MVYSLSTAGGDPQVLSVPPPDDITFDTIVTDGAYIYGGPFNYNLIRRMPITGGVFAAITDGNAYGATRLRTNSTNVFAGFGLSSAAIKTFAKTGGGAITLIDSLTIDPSHYAEDEDYVYFINANRTVISRVAVSGGDPATVAPAAASEHFVDLAVSGDDLLFVSTTRVGRVERTGGTPETIEEGAAYALVTDSERVYYFRAKGQSETCASGSDLFSAPIAGGPRAALPPKQPNPALVPSTKILRPSTGSPERPSSRCPSSRARST
jgi:hypothetical protein